jgi:2-C-methyl-D-erythritol 4-phosphate cytidylyltransferase
MQKYAIIVAGGRGNRFKSELPKQFVELAGKPILMHSINAFYEYQNSLRINVVLPEDQFDLWSSLCEKYKFNLPHDLVKGGATRFHSVKNGLSLVEAEGLVAIHDGVRPLVDSETIHRCYQMAEDEGNAIPAVNLVDSMRQLESDDTNIHVDRSKYRLIQTPQVFKNELILKAFEQDYNLMFTDDASVLEAMYPGIIKLVEGNRQNIKITTPEDLLYAEAILQAREK